MQKKIVCVGDVSKNQLLSVDKLPNTKMGADVSSKTESFGGRGGVVALTLAQMTGGVELLSTIPNSEDGREARSFLQKHHVNTAGLLFDANANNIREETVVFSRHSSEYYSLCSPGDVDFIVNDGQRQIVAEADVAYFAVQENPYGQELLKEVDTSRTTVVYRASDNYALNQNCILGMLEKSSAVVCNEREAGALRQAAKITTLKNIFKLSEVLNAVYITFGEHGSIVYRRDQPTQRVRNQRLEAVTPIGAGDSYTAGILYGVAHEWVPEQNMLLAASLAELSLASTTAYPDLNRIPQVVQDFTQKAS